MTGLGVLAALAGLAILTATGGLRMRLAGAFFEAAADLLAVFLRVGDLRVANRVRYCS